MTDGKSVGGHMALVDYVRDDAVEIGALAADWRDAVTQAGKLLVRSGFAEERYVEAMISAVERYGPYCVIAPGLAVPHARPEEGALSAGIGLLMLRAPVTFGSAGNDPVDILIPFSSGSSSSHLDILRDLASFLSTPGVIEDLRKVKSALDFRTLLGTNLLRRNERR